MAQPALVSAPRARSLSHSMQAVADLATLPAETLAAHRGDTTVADPSSQGREHDRSRALAS